MQIDCKIWLPGFWFVYLFGKPFFFLLNVWWFVCVPARLFVCVCVCHKGFARGLCKDVYLWLLVFSLVFLLSSIAVVKSTQSLSFLFLSRSLFLPLSLSFFHFIKICQQPGGPFGCCLAAKYFFFCFPSLLPPLPLPPQQHHHHTPCLFLWSGR